MCEAGAKTGRSRAQFTTLTGLLWIGLPIHSANCVGSTGVERVLIIGGFGLGTVGRLVGIGPLVYDLLTSPLFQRDPARIG
jgi:hypothetical protein